MYVITPVELLYASEPSPPESVTEIAALDNASVYCVISFVSVNVPAASSYVDVIPVPPTTKPFTISSISSSVLPEELIVKVPFASSYDVVMFVPAVINALTLSSTLSSV